ncbi:unnamed protein product [Urochloa decumbens]|uniref:NB-ARC domain-containing protein n=1 Tax=Urochloa decumbens TaxID=240449 RepID=A0ABC9EIH7_9POAL
MSLFGLSSFLVPFIVALLLCCRRRKIQHESRLLFRQRLREEEAIPDKEARRSLTRSRRLAYFEQQLLTSTDDVAKRKQSLQAIDSLNKWGLVRAGIQRRDLHGMDSYEIEVLEFLEHGHGASSSLLGISGMRGVGKTTLLKLIRTAYRESYPTFDFVFYIEAGGAGFTAGVLRDALARRIGLDPPLSSQATDFPGAQRFFSFFRDSSFLLLLDDVRDGIDLAAAGLPMPLGPRRKVVFTTRNQAVCAKMGCACSNIQMQCLGEDVAWEMFRDCVGDRIISSDPAIEYLAKQIVAVSRLP